MRAQSRQPLDGTKRERIAFSNGSREALPGCRRLGMPRQPRSAPVRERERFKLSWSRVSLGQDLPPI
jgi:hypothetical protein